MRKPMLLICCLAVATLALAQDNPTPAPAATPTPIPLAAPTAPRFSSIKIVFENKAKYDGEVRFDFTPTGGTAKAIRVTVAAKMKGDDVARDAAKELKVALGPDYDVDRYDPDKIKIEAKKKTATFSLTLAALTATGLSVRLK